MRNFDKLEERIELELSWLWNRSDAEFGVKSNFAAILSGGERTREYRDGFDERHCRAVSKRRELEKTLFRCSRNCQNYLYARYGWNCRIPGYITSVFYDSASLICFLVEDPAELTRACQRKLSGKSTPEEIQELQTLLKMAERLHKNAILEFYDKEDYYDPEDH